MTFHETPIFDQMTIDRSGTPHLRELFGRHADSLRRMAELERQIRRPIMAASVTADPVHTVTELTKPRGDFRRWRDGIRAALKPPQSTGVGLDILTGGERG